MSDQVQPDAAKVQPDAEQIVATATITEPDPTDDAETFPASVVKDLRKESAGYRERAKDVSARLHTALVGATGLLADPTDLAYDPAHLDDADALTAAIDALLDAKPHLRSRKPAGDVGQGQHGASAGPPSFADLFKGA